MRKSATGRGGNRGDEENGTEEQVLQAAISNVHESAAQMKSALEEGSVRDAIKAASSGLLSELRTASLSPRLYYVLYTRIFDELTVLEQSFVQDTKRSEYAPFHPIFTPFLLLGPATTPVGATTECCFSFIQHVHES